MADYTPDARQIHTLGATGSVRTEMYDGREHLVIPAVALIGNQVIHAVNSTHPERVPVETLVKAANSWNGRPAVLGHPSKNGRQISANDPNVLQQYGLGTIFNSRMAGPKMLMDIYVDPAKAERVGGKEFVQQLRDGVMNEISVGAYVVADSIAGNLNGKSYVGSWGETTGDHVAILNKTPGACSIAMGCGTHRAASDTSETIYVPVEDALIAVLADASSTDDSLFRAAANPDGINQYSGANASKATDNAINSTAVAKRSTDLAFSTGSGVDHRGAASAHRNAQSAHVTAGNSNYHAGNHDKARDHFNQADVHAAASKDHQTRADDQSVGGSLRRQVRGAAMSKERRSIRERVIALLRDGAAMTPADDAEEVAELIQYRSMSQLIGQAADSLASARTLVDGLISAETDTASKTTDDEAAETEIEQASLEAVKATCTQVYSTMLGLITVVGSLLDDSASDIAGSGSYPMGLAAKSESDQKLIQQMHDKAAALGATCGGPKTLDGGNPNHDDKGLFSSGGSANADAKSANADAKSKSAAAEKATKATTWGRGTFENHKAAYEAHDAAAKAHAAAGLIALAANDNKSYAEHRAASEHHSDARDVHRDAANKIADKADAARGDSYQAQVVDERHPRILGGPGSESADLVVRTAADCAAIDALNEECNCGGHPLTASDATTTGDVIVMTKAERIAALVACNQNTFTETDRPFLDALTDAQLTTLADTPGAAALVVAATKAATERVIADKHTADEAFKAHAIKMAADKAASDQSDPGDETDPKTAGAKSVAQPNPLTEEQYLALAPESIRTLVSRQKSADAAQRTALVLVLKAAQDAYSESELNEMSLDALDRLTRVARAKTPVVDFSGRGVARSAADETGAPPPVDLFASIKALRAAQKQ